MPKMLQNFEAYGPDPGAKTLDNRERKTLTEKLLYDSLSLSNKNSWYKYTTRNW